MSACTKCQTLNAASAKFCQACGNCLVFAGAQMPSTNASAATQVLFNTATQVLPFKPGIVLPDKTRTQPTRLGRLRQERVVIVIDVSGSMDGRYDSKYSKIQSAIRACMSMLIEKKRIDPLAEIAIVVFNSRATVLIKMVPIGAHRAELFQVLQNLRADGGTDINEGLKAAEGLFDWSQADASNRVILMTDGQGGHPLETATAMKSRGAIIHVIGVGDEPSNVDEPLLRQVASTLNNELQYWFLKTHAELVEGVTRLANTTAVA